MLLAFIHMLATHWVLAAPKNQACFFFGGGVGKLFITSVKHTCSKRTTRAMFSLCAD